MLLFKKFYHWFFFIGLFFLPFNSEIPDWISFLGEYSTDSSPIFFLISFAFLGISILVGNKVFIPIKNTEITLLLFFTIILLISTLISLSAILDYYFKQTTGVERFVRQLISLLISSVLFLMLFVNVCKDYGVERFFVLVRKIMLWSLIIAFVYGVIEFAIVNYHVSGLLSIIRLFDNLPFVKVKLSYGLARVSSLTYEPPALGTYLITISGFMFSYILTSKNKFLKFFPFLMVLFLGLVSKSRTAFVVLALQILVGVFFAYLIYPKFRNFVNKAVAFGFVLSVIISFVFWEDISSSVQQRLKTLDFTELKYDPKSNSISNKSRLGIQYALLQTYKEHPIFGTGWGQQAFESRHHYPGWAVRDNYEFSSSYLNPNVKSFPPGFNLYLRILTETGILGFFVFMLFIFSVFRSCMQGYLKAGKERYISVALLISFTGLAFNWFQIDSFRIYGFWISLAILIIYKKKYNEQDNRPDPALQQF